MLGKLKAGSKGATPISVPSPLSVGVGSVIKLGFGFLIGFQLKSPLMLDMSVNVALRIIQIAENGCNPMRFQLTEVFYIST